MPTTAKLEEAINNLENTSVILEQCANNPRNYNTDFAHYLELMSFEMRKSANEIREHRYVLGGLS